MYEESWCSAVRDSLWNSLMNRLLAKCNRMMGMIKHTVGYTAHIISVTFHLYSERVLSLNTVLQYDFHFKKWNVRIIIYLLANYTLYTELSWFKIKRDITLLQNLRNYLSLYMSFLYKPWKPKGFIHFEIIINVLVSSFWFMWIRMWWVYDH